MSKKKLPLLLPFRSLIFLLIFLAGSAITGKKLREISSWWSIIATIVNIITILLLLFTARKTDQNYWQLINFKRGKRSIKKTALLSIGFAVVGMSGMYLSGLICYGSVMPAISVKIVAPIPVVLAVFNLVLLPTTVPFAEDGLYLGCGVNNIENKYAAVVIPAFFYALQHCFIPTLCDTRYILYRFLSFLPLTFLFCLYYRKKRDPLPIMISHALLDLASAEMILMTSAVPGLYDKWSNM